MENSVEPKAFQLPLELQFSMRKAEMRATEMTWDALPSFVEPISPASNGMACSEVSYGRRKC